MASIDFEYNDEDFEEQEELVSVGSSYECDEGIEGEFGDCEENQDQEQVVGYIKSDQKEQLLPLEDILPKNLIQSERAKLRAKVQGKFSDDKFNQKTNEEAGTCEECDWPNFHWKDIQDVYEGQGTMYDVIQPTDIQQGNLGSCYMLSAMSSLAERPAFIRRLFEGQNLCPKGVNAVWFNINGVWKEIIVDNSFPCSNETGGLAFATARGNSCWVSFVEKAYGKAFGSYFKINGGEEVEALRDLTGAPYEKLTAEDFKNPKYVWERVSSADKKGYVMVTGITEDKTSNGGKGGEGHLDNGLVTGHAYSLVGAAEVKGSDGQMHKIVQVRNPFGSTEWTGDWSDNSPQWTPESMAQVTHDSGDDGIFWMSLQDFCTNFNDAGIVKIHANFYFNHLNVPVSITGDKHLSTVIVSVQTEGKYYFSVDQQDSRLKAEDVDLYQVRLTMLKLEPSGVKFLSCAASQDRCTTVKCSLKPGKYLALVELVGPQGDLYYNLCSYGVDLAGFALQKLSPQEYCFLEYFAWKDYAINNREKWMKKKELTDINGCQVQVEIADRQREFGTTITKFTVVGGGDNQPLVHNDTNGVVEVGTFDVGVQIKKSNGGQSKLLVGEGSGKSPVATMSKSIASIPVSIPVCKVNPKQNPYLQSK